MEEVYPNLYVGSDIDVPRAQAKNFSICSVCKEGPNGHRSVLKYNTLGAPKGKEYLIARRGKHLALNVIDIDDPEYIHDEPINAALSFIDERLKAGDKVLVHCNQGHSRGPTTAMMFLRSIGDLPDRYYMAYKIFKTLYPKYDPAQGMKQYSKSHWATLKKG